MSDEEMKRSMGSAIEPPSVGSSEYTPTPEPTPLNENEGLRAKLRLYEEEELLMIRRPSLFAFMPAYLVGLGVWPFTYSLDGHRRQRMLHSLNQCSSSWL